MSSVVKHGLEIVFPGDWSTVSTEPNIIVRAPERVHIRAVFLKKAVWSADELSNDGTSVELMMDDESEYHMTVVVPPRALPEGDIVVRVEDVDGRYAPVFLGLACSTHVRKPNITGRSAGTAGVHAVFFATDDLGQPDCIPGARLLPTHSVDIDGLFNWQNESEPSKCTVRQAEAHSLTSEQIASESIWGDDTHYMVARTNWHTPSTYLLASSRSLVNLRNGFVMPRPGAIWADTFVSAWRDFVAPAKQAGGMLDFDGNLFFSEASAQTSEAEVDVAYHFCPPFHFTYGHWVTEALTGLWLLKDQIQAGLCTPISPVLQPWQLESIQALGINTSKFKFFESEYVTCERMISHSLFRMTTGWGAPAPEDKTIPRSTIRELTTWGWGSAVHDLLQELKGRFHGTSGIGHPERIIIDRGGLNHPRQLSNFAELGTRLAASGFAVVHPETLSIDEEVDLFSGAKVIVAQQGSGLINVAFAPPGCHVIEIVPDHYVYDHFRWLAALCGHRYSRIVVPGNPTSPVPWGPSSMRVPICKVLERVNS